MSGEQLYLYSTISRNYRRLTSLNDSTLRVDFAPNGDFLLYSSVPGATQRQSGSISSNRTPDQLTEDQGKGANIRAWEIQFVPWIPKNFTTGISDVMKPEEMQLLVSWSVIPDQKIGFEWGPGGEWIDPENR